MVELMNDHVIYI